MAIMKLPILTVILLTFLTFSAAAPTPSPHFRITLPNYIGLPIDNIDASDPVPNSYLAVYHSNATSEAVKTHQKSITHKLAKRGMGGTMKTYQISGWNAFAIEADEKTMMEIYNAPEVGQNNHRHP
jgi:hypothetical protein